MLTRRHIRIKVFQALYQYFQNPNSNPSAGARKLEESINNVYDLYLYELKILTNILRIAEDEIERRKQKRLPTKEDLDPPTRFVENQFLNWLSSNKDFKTKVEQRHISWGDDRDILRRIFKEVEKTDEYNRYIYDRESSEQSDRRFVKWLYGKFIVTDELIHQIYEDKNMHWADDLDAAQMMVAKTIRKFDADKGEESRLPSLLNDSADLDFALVLYRKSIVNSEKYEEMIHEKAKNWEMDRIALVDIIFMKMAIAELTNFNEIPVKVTLNEYIELSKEYSTPKSGNFINGILDKLKEEMAEKGDIRKIGRGLL